MFYHLFEIKYFSVLAPDFVNTLDPVHTGCNQKGTVEVNLTISHLLALSYISKLSEVVTILTRLAFIFPSGFMRSNLLNLCEYIRGRADLLEECINSVEVRFAFFCAFLHVMNIFEKPRILQGLFHNLTQTTNSPTAILHYCYQTFPGDILLNPIKYKWNCEFFCSFFAAFSRFRIKYEPNGGIPSLLHFLILFEDKYSLYIPVKCYKYSAIQASSSRDPRAILMLYFRIKHKFLHSAESSYQVEDLVQVVQVLVKYFSYERNLSILHIMYDEVMAEYEQQKSEFINAVGVALVGVFCKLHFYPYIQGLLLRFYKNNNKETLHRALLIVADYFGSFTGSGRSRSFLNWLISLSKISSSQMEFITYLPLRALFNFDSFTFLPLNSVPSMSTIYNNNNFSLIASKNKHFANNILEATLINPLVVARLFPNFFDLKLSSIFLRSKVLPYRLTGGPFQKEYWRLVNHVVSSTPLSIIFYYFHSVWGYRETDLSLGAYLALLRKIPLVNEQQQINSILISFFSSIEVNESTRPLWSSPRLFPFVAIVFILDHRWHLLASLLENTLLYRQKDLALEDQVHQGMKSSRAPIPHSLLLDEASHHLLWTILRNYSDDILSTCYSSSMNILPNSMGVEEGLLLATNDQLDLYGSEILIWCTERHLITVGDLRAYFSISRKTNLDVISEKTLLVLIHLPGLFIRIRDTLWNSISRNYGIA